MSDSPDETNASPDAQERANVQLPNVLKAAHLAEAGRGESIRALFTEEQAPRMIKRRVWRSIRQVHTALSQADEEAKRLIEEARAEADAIREAAREEGYQDGLRQLTQALAKARDEYTRVMEESEDDMLELAVRMAERIVRQRIELEPSTAAEITRGCLEIVRDRQQITVFANPQDLPALEQWRESLVQVVEARFIHFEPDPNVGRGGCMIETEAGRVDARLEVQLESFKRALMA